MNHELSNSRLRTSSHFATKLRIGLLVDPPARQRGVSVSANPPYGSQMSRGRSLCHHSDDACCHRKTSENSAKNAKPDHMRSLRCIDLDQGLGHQIQKKA